MKGCQLCWLCMDEREAEVIFRLYLCYNVCIVSKQWPDCAVCFMEAWEQSHSMSVLNRSVTQRVDSPEETSRADWTRVNPGRAGHRAVCVCVSVCVWGAESHSLSRVSYSPLLGPFLLSLLPFLLLVRSCFPSLMCVFPVSALIYLSFLTEYPHLPFLFPPS